VKTLTASAPGKLVVLGEYAVLFGATALVLAVNRRAQVRLTPAAQSVWELRAPQVLERPQRFRIEADGALRWQSDDPRLSGRVELVSQIFRGLIESGRLKPSAPARLVEVDTAAFFEASEPDAGKFGLGSSAALTVALASALVCDAGDQAIVENQPLWLSELLELHRRFQGGQGSGLDVAASLYGGLIAYRMPAGAAPAAVTPVAWPASLHALCVWSGESASTPAFLRQMLRWREEEPDAFERSMQTLRRLADEAASLLAAGLTADWLATASAYTEALQAFGEHAKIAVFTAAHHKIGALARGHGALYKPCGAGGGDIGIALAADVEVLAHARQAIEAEGYMTVALARDPNGLVLQAQRD
jgi:phosphomevalonate kinase